jgi:hypothetical protein
VRYEVYDGRIATWSLEVHVVDHCNLRCAQCCTLSPHRPPRATAPDRLERDLGLAARWLRPHVLKITGGEPLLHPDILGCLEAARASRIADRISVTTNGLLLERVPDAFWKGIDRLTLSRYASHPLDEDRVGWIRARCDEHRVLLTVKMVDAFQRITLEHARFEPSETARVFESCWLKVRCHLLYEARLFSCTRPPAVEGWLGAQGEPARLCEHDGLALERVELLDTVRFHLEASAPLRTCAYCLGASGPMEPHAQIGAGVSTGRDDRRLSVTAPGRAPSPR